MLHLWNTQTCKTEYALARHIEPWWGIQRRENNTTKQNMSRAMCALSIYSRLCMKMPHILYLSCGTPFLVKTPGIIFGCGVAVKVRSYQEKFQVIFLRGGGHKFFFEGRANFLRSSSFLTSFSFLRSSSFLRLSSILRSSFWGHLQNLLDE